MTRFLLVSILLCFAWLASAQASVRIDAPQPRSALPGDFVTLVFRLHSEAARTVDVEAASSKEWIILRQPGEVDLEADKARPVAITLGVPADAAAFLTDTVTLTVKTGGETLSATVEITVAELRGLDLEAPEEVVVGEEGFEVTVVNHGNVAQEATLQLVGAGQALAEVKLSLAAQEKREVRLQTVEAGLFSIVLSTAEGEVATKGIRLIRFGIPQANPFVVVGEAKASLDSEANWQSLLELEGELSDYTALRSRLDASAWRSSFAQLAGETWTARLGAGGSDPFKLSFPADFGLAGNYIYDAWSVAGAFGVSANNTLSGFTAGRFQQAQGSVALGAGWRNNTFLARGRGEWTFFEVTSGETVLEEINLRGTLNYAYPALNLSSTASLRDLPGQLSIGTSLNGLFTNSAQVALSGNYQANEASINASGTFALTDETEGDYTFGVSTAVPSELPGQLSFDTQLGRRNGFSRLSYGVDTPWGWRNRSQAGFLYDEQGGALDLGTSWSAVGPTYLNFDAQFRLYPSSGLTGGHFGYGYQSPILAEVWTVYSSGGWNLNNQSVGLGGGALYQGAGWQLNASTDVAYAYRKANPWSAVVSLSGSYQFNLDVPLALTELSGGRRVGTITGRVLAGETALENVEVRVGQFRLLTDAAGRYEAELSPGSYKVRVDLASLPLTYRLEREREVTFELAAKETLTLDFRAVETAALQGQVLQDTDADGVADEPPRGLEANLLITDAEGLQRAIVTDSSGTFSVKGLLPGTVTLTLRDSPLGSVIVGEATQTLSAQAGEISDVVFLLQPAAARAESFSGSALRVRRITPEVERAPPGSAPLISAEVQGEPVEVLLRSELGEIPLSLEDGNWLGRLAIPSDSADGPLRFEVIVRKEGDEKSRRGQLIIDGNAPAFTIGVDGPVEPSNTLSLRVNTYFAASSVLVRHPFGDDLELAGNATQNLWEGVLSVPEATEDDIYTLTFVVTNSDGTVYEQEERFRVIVP